MPGRKADWEPVESVCRVPNPLASPYPPHKPKASCCPEPPCAPERNSRSTPTSPTPAPAPSSYQPKSSLGVQVSFIGWQDLNRLLSGIGALESLVWPPAVLQDGVGGWVRWNGIRRIES